MSMSISSVRSAPVRSTEASEGPGPDKVPDGDADDCAGLLPVAPNCHVALHVCVEEFVDRFRSRLGLVAQ